MSLNHPVPISATERRSALWELHEDDHLAIRALGHRDPDHAPIGQGLVDDPRWHAVSAGKDPGDQVVDGGDTEVDGEDAGVVRGSLGSRATARLLVFDEFD